MQIKKIAALLLALTMTLSLVACGSANSSTNNSNADNTPAQGANDDAENTNSVSADSADTADTEAAERDRKVLAVYYSASGNTGRVAEIIADELGADTFEIVPVDAYSNDDLNWRDRNSRVCREYADASLQDIALISTEVPGWNEYDIVLIGYPIWWREASWVVNNFVKGNDFSGKTVVPFCTSTSSGLGSSGTNLAKMAGTGNWLEGKRFSENAAENSIREWVRGLNLE